MNIDIPIVTFIWLMFSSFCFWAGYKCGEAEKKTNEYGRWIENHDEEQGEGMDKIKEMEEKK